MSRSRQFQYIDHADVCDEVRSVYNDFVQVTGMPFVIDYLRCRSSYPGLLQDNRSKIEHALLSGQILLLLEELVMYSISRQRGCKYFTFLHGMVADRLQMNV